MEVPIQKPRAVISALPACRFFNPQPQAVPGRLYLQARRSKPTKVRTPWRQHTSEIMQGPLKTQAGGFSRVTSVSPPQGIEGCMGPARLALPSRRQNAYLGIKADGVRQRCFLRTVMRVQLHVRLVLTSGFSIRSRFFLLGFGVLLRVQRVMQV